MNISPAIHRLIQPVALVGVGLLFGGGLVALGSDDGWAKEIVTAAASTTTTARTEAPTTTITAAPTTTITTVAPPTTSAPITASPAPTVTTTTRPKPTATTRLAAPPPPPSGTCYLGPASGGYSGAIQATRSECVGNPNGQRWGSTFVPGSLPQAVELAYHQAET